MLSIQNLPFSLIAGHPVSAKLIIEELPVLTIGHPVDVFDDECLRANDTENPVKLLI